VGWLDGLRFRLRQRLDPGRAERELDEELRLHLELETRSRMEPGLGRSQARRCALEAFGGVEHVKQACRESWGARLVDSVAFDSRVGLRGLVRNPGFTAAAALTLALGIGANTAVFSVVNGVLLQPLPYRDGERLLMVRLSAPAAGIDALGFSFAEIEAFRDRSPSLAGLAEYHELWFTLLGGDEPERVRTGIVSADFFDVLGVEPLHGRGFRPGDEAHAAPAVLVLSHEYWQRRHGGDPEIVGRVFEMNDRPHTVVGVLPPLPAFPRVDDVYMPIAACPFRTANAASGDPTVRMIPILFARLAPGADAAAAAAELKRLAGELERRHPEAYPASGLLRIELVPLQSALTARARPLLLLLLATAGLVLLNATANVANVVLARLLRREQELALRRALGASRRRLVRQLVTEGALLSAAGGALGVLLAFLARDALVAWASRFTPRAAEVQVDGAVLLFALGVCAVTTLGLGLLPALPARERLAATLAGARGRLGLGRRPLQSGLIVAQLAVSFVLLCAAGLTTRRLIELHRTDPGFAHENVLAVDLDLDFTRYGGLREVPGFFDDVLRRVRRIPGVISTAASLSFPLSDALESDSFEPEHARVARREIRPRAARRSVSPGYFRTVGIALQSGRLFGDCDAANTEPVVVVSHGLAEGHFPGGQAVGRRLTFDRGRSWHRVIGVVSDVRQRLESEPEPELYLPLAQSPSWQASVLVRTATGRGEIEELLRRAIWSVDPDQPVGDARTLAQVRQFRLAPPKLTALLLGLFASLALAITATGIGGAIAYAVGERRREIGIRMALGAAPRQVVRMLLLEALGLVVVGLGLGIAGSTAVSAQLSERLSAGGPQDPLLVAVVALTLLVVAGAACLFPARRAAAIDPIAAVASE
jgi:predicted permease